MLCAVAAGNAKLTVPRPVVKPLGVEAVLSNKAKLGREVIELAEAQGISPATLKRAKAKLQVVTEKSEYQGQTFWNLPM